MAKFIPNSSRKENGARNAYSATCFFPLPALIEVSDTTAEEGNKSSWGRNKNKQAFGDFVTPLVLWWSSASVWKRQQLITRIPTYIWRISLIQKDHEELCTGEVWITLLSPSSQRGEKAVIGLGKGNWLMASVTLLLRERRTLSVRQKITA